MSEGFINETSLLSGLLAYPVGKVENYTNLTGNYPDGISTVVEHQQNAMNLSGSAPAKMSWLSGGKIQIPFYTIILLLSVVGNLLVISTLVQNRRMRTITNLFLLNLAISDILLGVLCMPVTLVGTLLRHFIFGAFLCKLIPFLQATSVAVSSWTLVAISCERYYAICHPLRSRTWQTISHAYKIIGFIWMGSFVCMSPIAGFSQLIPTSQVYLSIGIGLRKCREYWPEDAIVYERTYNILLDLILLVLPLMVLCAAYILITRTLYMGMKNEKIIKNSTTALNVSITVSFRQESIDQEEFQQYDEFQRRKIYPDTRLTNFSRSPSMKSFDRRFNVNTNNGSRMTHNRKPTSTPVLKCDSILRKSNVTKNLESKRRVVKMLFVLVLEFFICWTPLYVINTMTLFNPVLIYQNVGYTAISFLQLLAYSSSCCNPITYCFMNAGFRRAFLDTFKGLHAAGRCWRKETPISNGVLESPKIQSRH